MWSKKVIDDHKEAGKRLTAIVHDAFAYLRDHPRATEGETKDLILAQFKRHSIVMDKPFATPIVGFNDHSAEPHYYPVPGSRRLAPGTLVLIDIWGRLKGKHMPYADITWMGYCGGKGKSIGGKKSSAKVPKEMQKVFGAVLAARDACLDSVRRAARRGKLPIGRDANEVANAVIRKAGYGKYIRHSTGHALGFASPHGRGRHLNTKNRYPLLKELGYTIEPGIYIKKRFGVRSEMNFYVDRSGRVVITTPLQRRLVVI